MFNFVVSPKPTDFLALLVSTTSRRNSGSRNTDIGGNCISSSEVIMGRPLLTMVGFIPNTDK